MTEAQHRNKQTQKKSRITRNTNQSSSNNQITMKTLKYLSLVIMLSISSIAASPADAGGCKFFGTTALSCEDGAGGYINTFFNGEKWTEPTSSRSASARDVPAGTVQIIRPIVIQQQIPQCRSFYCRTNYSDSNRGYYW